MTTTIIQYQLPAGVPVDAVKSGFLEVAPYFKSPPGLLRKYFLLSEDGATGGGVYLWDLTAECTRLFRRDYPRDDQREVSRGAVDCLFRNPRCRRQCFF